MSGKENNILGQKSKLFALFVGLGAILLLLKLVIEPAPAPTPQAPLIVPASKQDFHRYGAELGIELAGLGSELQLQHFQAFLEGDLLFHAALQDGRVWRDPVIQNLLVSNKQFLEIEHMTPELLENLLLSDIIIRRHVVRRAKHLMTYTGIGEPGEAELQSFYQQHADKFTSGARVDLTQRFYPTRNSAEQALESVTDENTTPGNEPGSSLPQTLTAASARDISRYFGASFADQIFLKLSQGQKERVWFGPLSSAYGFHLILLESYRESRPRPLNDSIRNQVTGLWRKAQGEKLYRERLAELKETATIKLDQQPAKSLAEISIEDLQRYL